MRTLIYLIMFAIVGTGSIIYLMLMCSIGFLFFINFVTLTTFAEPIPAFLFSMFPFAAGDMLMKALKVALVMLVFHRLYRIFTERRFKVPSTFNVALFNCATIGVVALLLTLPLIGVYIWLVSALSFVVAKVLLPLVFFITELLSVKAYFRGSQPLGNSK